MTDNCSPEARHAKITVRIGDRLESTYNTKEVKGTVLSFDLLVETCSGDLTTALVHQTLGGLSLAIRNQAPSLGPMVDVLTPEMVRNAIDRIPDRDLDDEDEDLEAIDDSSPRGGAQ